MTPDTLDEREFELVNIVGAQIANNQRDLSRRMELSLGTINMLIRRMVTKGYIRTKQLNQKKVEYILTPKGFTEKTRKSIKYTVKTLNSISLIKERLKKTVSALHARGERNFFILGESDLAVLVHMTFQEVGITDCQISRIKDVPKTKIEGTLLVCKEDVDCRPANVENSVDLIQELAQSIEHFSLKD